MAEAEGKLGKQGGPESQGLDFPELRGIETPLMSSGSLALVFAGQGSQAVGMGASLAAASPAAKALLDQADEVLGFALSQVMLSGPEEELTRTSFCQPALYVHGLMCLAALREALPEARIAGAAGLSLGEFTAHAAAGTFSFADGLRLVAKRGRFMEEACEASDGGMAAVIGGTVEQVRALADSVGAQVANLNAPGQTVISGPKEAIAAAVGKAKEAGCRLAKPLNVAGAYHSELMRPAQEKLAKELAAVALSKPSFPVISNYTAREVTEPSEIRETLERQVTGSVRWVESMELLSRGIGTFLEMGPGKVLTGLMSRINAEARCFPTGEATELAAAVAALKS